LKHRGTEAQRILEGEREGGKAEGGQTERGKAEGGQTERGKAERGMGMGIKKAPFGGKGAFIVFKCWPSDC
jgi:hypothetical protein